MTTSVRSAPSNLASAINAAVKLLPFRFFVSFEKSQNRRSRRVLATPFACPMVFPTNAFSHLNGSLDNGGSLTYAQPTQAQSVISSHAKSTEWPIDAYNFSMEAGYLPKYIFTCLHWNFVQCPLYPKTVNLDGGRKDGKYKGKSVPMSFGQQKMVRMLLEWVQHRDHMPYSVLTQMLKQSHPYLMLQPTMCRIWGYTSEGSDWLSAPRSYPLLWPG